MAGDSKRRTRPPADAHPLEDIVLRDWRGEEVRLGDTWAEGPAVLVFLRHYGWTFCRDHAVQLHRDRDRFREAGADLVVVGQGRPEHAAHFRKTQKVDLPLLVDTDRKAYKAAGTKVGSLSELLGPRVVLKGARRTLASRVHQGRTVGHAAQLGGVMVVMPDGSIPYVHLSEDAGDNPPNEEVLEAIRAASGAA